MKSSLKDGDFFQSESSPSFKNLRIDGDSPTRINFLQQKLLSQQSIDHYISSSDTPTMKKTGSFKNDQQLIKAQSKDKQNEKPLNNMDDEFSKQLTHQNKKIIQNSQGNNSTTASGKQKNKRQIEDYVININEISNHQQLQQLSRQNQNRLSGSLSEFKMSDTNELQSQNSIVSSGVQYSNQNSIQGDQKRSNSNDKVENKNEIYQKLVYNREIECKYNNQQQRYSGNCNIHNYEQLNFVCFTCNEILCNECINIHIEHQIQTIKNSYPICKEAIQESLKLLNKNIEQLLIRSEDLTSIQNDIIETFQQQKHEIQRCYKIIVEQIKMKSNELLEFCNKLYNEKLEYVVKEHTQIRKGLNNMIQSHSVIEQNIELQDPFVTCDYYVKKLKFINQIVQNDSQENSFFAQISPQIQSLSNQSYIQQKSIYQIFPQNNRLQINNKKLTNQIEREYNQQKINLTNFNLNENKNKYNSLRINCNQKQDNKNIKNLNEIQNDYHQYSVNNNLKSDFMSLQSSPLTRYSQPFISNKITFQNKTKLMNLQYDLFQKNSKKIEYHKNNILSQNIKDDNIIQRYGNIFDKDIHNNNLQNKYNIDNININKDKYYFSEKNNLNNNYNLNQFNHIKQTQVKDQISNLISQKYLQIQDTSDFKRQTEFQSQNSGLNKYSFNIDNETDILKQIPPNSSLSDLSLNSITNQKLNNSYSKFLNQQNCQNKDDILNQNNSSDNIMTIHPSDKNTFQMQQKTNNVHLSKNNQNNISNNSSACSSSTRVPAPISKTPSPNKINNEIQFERKNPLFSNSKENKMQLSLKHKEKPFYLQSSDKGEKETSPKYITSINKQQASFDDKFNKKSYNQIKHYNSSKFDLFSTEKNKNNLSNIDLNNDSSNLQKINKEIEEIKQLLNQSSLNQQQFLSKSKFKKNKVNNKDFRDQIRSSFSAAHSPVRDSSDNKPTQLLNNFNIFNSQSNKVQTFDRSKSPNFFRADRYEPKQSTINPSNLNPSIQHILSSQQTQIKSEKILNASFQIEGFLNSIRNNDRLLSQFEKQKVQNYNFDNSLYLQQKQALQSASQQQNINTTYKNNQQQPNKIDIQPQIRAYSVHQQQEDSPLHKLSKERFTEKLVQNLQKFRELNNENCTERCQLGESKKDN